MLKVLKWSRSDSLFWSRERTGPAVLGDTASSWERSGVEVMLRSPAAGSRLTGMFQKKKLGTHMVP